MRRSLWRSAAAASKRPPRCSPLCSTIVTAEDDDVRERRRGWEGVETLFAQERTNYPFVVSIDDLGEDFAATAQTHHAIDPARICDYLRRALETLVAALDHAPSTPTRELDILPEAERARLLTEWNDTARDYPSRLCLHEIVRSAGAAQPGGRARSSAARRGFPIAS